MKLPTTSRILSSLAILLCLTIVSAVSTAPQNSAPQGTAPQSGETATWNVPLRSNQVRPSTVTATNDCFGAHQFQIQPDHLPFMRLQGPASFSVAPRAERIVPVEFDARALKSGTYDAVLTVRCMDCKGERGCKEDHKDLHVFLTVFPNWTEIYPEQKGSVKENPALRWTNVSPEQKSN